MKSIMTAWDAPQSHMETGGCVLLTGTNLSSVLMGAWYRPCTAVPGDMTSKTASVA